MVHFFYYYWCWYTLAFTDTTHIPHRWFRYYNFDFLPEKQYHLLLFIKFKTYLNTQSSIYDKSIAIIEDLKNVKIVVIISFFLFLFGAASASVDREFLKSQTIIFSYCQLMLYPLNILNSSYLLRILYMRRFNWSYKCRANGGKIWFVRQNFIKRPGKSNFFSKRETLYLDVLLICTNSSIWWNCSVG